jgi:MarR family transcriptional regulator, organic hydroperoxide resistance regulator
LQKLKIERTLSSDRDLTKEQEYYSWVTLSRTNLAILKVRQKEMLRSGISLAQSSILSIVYTRNNRVTPAEISRELMRNPNTVTELLFSMEKDGLLKRVKDMPRKNMIRVELTEKGLEAYHRVTRGQSISEILSVLTKEEQRQMVAHLERVKNKAISMM